MCLDARGGVFMHFVKSLILVSLIPPIISFLHLGLLILLLKITALLAEW